MSGSGKFLKLYGERNTSSRYVAALIRKNLRVRLVRSNKFMLIDDWQRRLPGKEWLRDLYFRFTYSQNLGWKHAKVRSREELSVAKELYPDLMYVTLTKNPYSWLLSLYRRPYHMYLGDPKPSFEEFLSMPRKTLGRDDMSEKFATPIELWNVKNRSYLSLDDELTVRLKSEEVLEDPAAALSRIALVKSLKWKEKEFVDYKQSTKGESKTSEDYRRYYLAEEWREQLTPESTQIINRSIDRDLMDYFGYNLIE